MSGRSWLSKHPTGPVGTDRVQVAVSGADDPPTFADIVEATGLNPHQARRALTHLVESGDLSIYRQSGPDNTVVYEPATDGRNADTD